MLVNNSAQRRAAKSNSLFAAELDPLLGIVGLLVDDVPTVVRVVIAQRQECMLQRLGPGARQSHAQNLHWLVAPAGWRLGHRVDVVLEEPDEPVVDGWHVEARRRAFRGADSMGRYKWPTDLDLEVVETGAFSMKEDSLLQFNLIAAC